MSFAFAIWYVLAFTVNQVVGFASAVLLVAMTFLLGLLKSTGLRLNRKDALYALYAAIALLPTIRFWSAYDFTFYMRVVLYPWFVSIVFQHVRLTWPRLRIWSFATIAVCLVTVGIMLFQDAPGSFDLSFRRLIELDRTRGFYYKGDERIGPNAAAAMSVAGVAICLALLRFRQVSPMVGVALAGVLTVLLGVAGGRIALAGLVALVGMFVLTGVLRGSGASRLRNALVSALVVVLLSVGLGTLFQTLARSQGGAFTERVEGVSNPMEDRSLLVRVRDWQRAVEMIREEPLGLGFNAYYAQYERTPHNELLGQWIGGGWAGTILYLVLMGFLTFRSTVEVFRRRTDGESEFGHYLALSMLGVTWLAMVTEHISRGGMNTFYPVLWMCIGLSYGRVGAGSRHEPVGDVKGSRVPLAW